jgi:competence protein ComEC
MDNGAFVTLALKSDALGDDCERAALVVTARQAPPSCASPVVDQDRLRRQGALALRRTGNGFAIDAIRPKGFDRPWSPAVAGDTETEASLMRRVPAGAIDATPSEADLQAEE